jgi:hypothetical protein
MVEVPKGLDPIGIQDWYYGWFHVHSCMGSYTQVAFPFPLGTSLYQAWFEAYKRKPLACTKRREAKEKLCCVHEFREAFFLTISFIHP